MSFQTSSVGEFQ